MLLYEVFTIGRFLLLLLIHYLGKVLNVQYRNGVIFDTFFPHVHVYSSLLILGFKIVFRTVRSNSLFFRRLSISQIERTRNRSNVARRL